jgi:glycosyltransferase involved in cell wall biosynthesis
MKALVIAPQPFFSPRGTPFSVYYRTLVTAELGVKVDVVTYGEGQDVDIDGVRIFRIPRFRALGRVKIGPSVLKLFLDVFLLLWTIALLARYRYHLVHAHEESIFFARFLKPLFRFKLVYDMHSSLPEQLTNFNFTKSRLLIGTFRALEDSALRAADAVITICPALADYATARIPDPDKHFLIENSIFDPVKISNATRTGDRGSELGAVDAGTAIAIPKGAQAVVYAGTLEAYQGIDVLLEAFAHVSEVESEAFLVIVGGSEQQVKQYATEAQEKGIANRCVFTGSVSPALARRYNQQATVLVSPRLTGLNTPLKIYEQLASGVPLVATRIYAHTQVLDENTAFLVEPLAADMARGIALALSSSTERQRKAENARRLYQEKYSRSAYVEKMRKLLGRLG